MSGRASARRLVIVGAGGLARHLAWLIGESRPDGGKRWEVVGSIVSDPAKDPDNRTILGDLSWIDEQASAVDGASIAIGVPKAKAELAQRIMSANPTLEWPTFIHRSVILDWSTADVADGVTLCANVVGSVNVSVGTNSWINFGCTLGHEAAIGSDCVLHTSVNIGGGAIIGDKTLVGTGAQILQYVTVGEGATVGAGAVVTKDVPPGVTVIGIPARPLERP